jgi:sugar/nucleoside kinase (ribokinase family)
MKILVFGSLNIDLTFLVDHIVRPGETIGSASLRKSAGGKGANQAAALAKAGAPVYMAGKIGQDGRFLSGLLDKLLGRFPGAEIILTAGKDGAFYGRGEIREKGEIVDMPVIDTTGAGDTFTGYFLATRYRGCTVAEALAIACKAASIAVSRKGAMEAIPFANEVFP